MEAIRIEEDGVYVAKEYQTISYQIIGAGQVSVGSHGGKSGRLATGKIVIPPGEYPIKVGKDGGASSAFGLTVAGGGPILIEGGDSRPGGSGVVVVIEGDAFSQNNAGCSLGRAMLAGSGGGGSN